MLILSKIVYVFITPLTWLLIALIISVLAKRKRIKRVARISSLAIVLFFSNTFIYKEILRGWEIHAVSFESVNHHDVALVLGGMFEYDHSVDRISVRRGADRIWQALTLYNQKKVKKLCIIGHHGDVIDKGLDEAVQLKEKLIEFGIPETDILIETKSRNTNENAKYTTELLQQSYPHFNSFILVTSARHMRRAKASFENYGLKVTPFSTDQYTAENRFYTWDEFIIPSADTFNEWFGLLKEIVGYAWHSIAY